MQFKPLKGMKDFSLDKGKIKDLPSSMLKAKLSFIL